MPTKTIDLQIEQANLQDLLALVQAGTDVILTEGTTPIAQLIAIASTTPSRVAGLHAGSMQMSSDFNEPLPETFWLGNS
ncbi:MAG: hypothetical protein KME12_14175 [Trichocoleus desertorum ATA4-8-CV12]|jgi:antitoxin (DNA-binding transcriptional repressor) of toxin-antitoxin stability system|nr:hypothetical protein [Trichocoleus desertorum ATA4-8-CV12]